MFETQTTLTTVVKRVRKMTKIIVFAKGQV